MDKREQEILVETAFLANINMRVIFLIFVAFMSAAFGRDSTKDSDIIFQLISISKNAELNTLLLEKIAKADFGDEMSEAISSLFDPIKGERNVYFFRAAFWGVGKFREEPQILHDLLVFSVNKDGVILDGFSYTEEWREMPLFFDLQRISVKGLRLSLLKNVSQLKLMPAIQNIGDKVSFSRGIIDTKLRINERISDGTKE